MKLEITFNVMPIEEKGSPCDPAPKCWHILEEFKREVIHVMPVDARIATNYFHLPNVLRCTLKLFHPLSHQKVDKNG